MANHYLLIHSAQPENAFGRFAHELLKSEGLNSFHIHDLDSAGLPRLEPGDLAVLTRSFLRKGEIEALHAAVTAGAGVVVLAPSALLIETFGWRPAMRVIHPAWVLLDDPAAGGALHLQTHVPLVLAHPPDSADAAVETLAQATDAGWNDSGFPATALQKTGAGAIAFFFYDLPHAVARIRFGDPDLASFQTTGLWNWTHACDLFAGHVDPRVMHLPQGDIHGQLLARAVTAVCPYPLARFWYYERAEQPSGAVFESDDDWSTPEQFRALADCLDAHGATCTFQLVEETRLPDTQVSEMRRHGHSFAPHVNAIGGPPGIKEQHLRDEPALGFETQLRHETAAFRRRYGSVSPALQCHAAPWRGYTEWVPLHIELGYRLLFGYLSYPMNSFTCGSGRPIRFAARDGMVHDCWQQPLITYDDASVKKRMGSDPAGVIREFETLLGVSMRYHTAVCIQSHPVSFAGYSKPFIDAALDRLNRAHVPIWNGDQWLAFHDRRAAAELRQTATAPGITGVEVRKAPGVLTLLFPAGTGAGGRMSVNGAGAACQRVRRFGCDFNAVELPADTGVVRVEFRTAE